MTIFHSAYDTTVGRAYKVDEVKKGIIEAVASKYLNKSPVGVTPIENTQNVPADIPTFTHPLYIDKTPYDGLYVDVRSYVRHEKMLGRTIITSKVDYDFQMLRSKLETMLRDGALGYFRLQSALPASVYSGWLTQGISKIYNLPPEDQYVLSILTAHFFFSFFTDEKEVDQLTLQKSVPLIARATRASADKIFEVLEGVDYIGSLQEYVEVVKDRMGARVAKLDVRTLITMLASSFWINNGSEVVGVGLEHMPTFYAMVYTVVREDSHRRSRLAEVVKYCPAKNAADSFATQLTLLMKDDRK